MTLADKLGLPRKESPLLAKAASLGLNDDAQLAALVVARGCWHYEQPGQKTARDIPKASLSNEELAIALLSPAQGYSPSTIRLGAAMLGAEGNNPAHIARLAKAEGAEVAVRYVAQAGLQFEPDNPFWRVLLEEVPPVDVPTSGVFPHPTRFVSMTGITRAGIGKFAVWIRPRTDVAVTHG